MMVKKGKHLTRFLLWRLRNIKERRFILFLSFIIGLLSGLSAVILKTAIHKLDFFLSEFLPAKIHYGYLVFPLIGIGLTVLYIRLFVKDNIGHGVSRILYALSRKNARIKRHNNYSSVVASTLTIGFGGSVGAEAPIVLTGASIGSTIGSYVRLNFKSVALLVACGAAGAIAGIFKAPIAGLVFTLEVLMLDLTLASIVPLLISSVTGAVVAYFLMGEGVVLSVGNTAPFDMGNIPFYILLGILAGFISLYFTRATMYVESKIGKVKSQFQRIAAGGLILAALIFIFPSLYGEGNQMLQGLLNGSASGVSSNWFFEWGAGNQWYLLLYLGLIIFLKVIAMAVTNGSGGVGGIFGPTLFVGGTVGYWLSHFINTVGWAKLPEGNFALVGMAGLMAGVMHAPLTAIFLIAEITGGYSLFIPLIITSTIAYLTIRYFTHYSIYTHRLAERGELLTHHKDRVVLTLMRLEKVVEKDFEIVHPDDTLGALVKSISKSRRNIYPVLDDEKQLIGIVLLDNVREMMFDQDLYEKTLVSDVMTLPPDIVNMNDNMEDVMKKFTETQAWNLPVQKDGKYLGFVSKSKIFNAYRELLVEVSEY